MRPNYSITQLQKDLDDKLSKGKIRGYVMPEIHKKSYDKIVGRKVAKHFEKKNVAKNWIAKNLFYYAQEKCWTLIEEYKFALPERQFKNDWGVLKDDKPIFVVEYEGLFSERSGHTSIKGIHRDIEKYGLLQKMGIPLIRLTALTYKELFNKINDVLK